MATGGKFQVEDDPFREKMWGADEREGRSNVEGYWWGGGRKRRNMIIQKTAETSGAGRVKL